MLEIWGEEGRSESPDPIPLPSLEPDLLPPLGPEPRTSLPWGRIGPDPSPPPG